MSDVYRPYSLIGVYEIDPQPSPLTKPYNLVAVYDPDAGDSTQAINGIGFNSSEFGDVKSTFDKDVVVVGFVATEFSQASIVNKARLISTTGINALSIGTHKLYNLTQQIQLFGRGIKVDSYGKPTVILNLKKIFPSSFNASAYGNVSRIEHHLRTIRTTGFTQASYGRPQIQVLNRFVVPTSIFTEFPTNHIVGGTRYIKPSGYVATQFGERIIPIIQNIYGRGFVATEFSQPELTLMLKVISPKGFYSVGTGEEYRWGNPYLYNKRQYIEMYHIHGSGLTPPPWSLWQKIENKIRTITVHGFLSERHGYTFIYNNARLIEPLGTQPPFFNKQQLVSYRIRKLPLNGIECPYFSGWGVVQNAAKVLYPAGFNAQLFGDASLENTTRIFNRIGNFETQEFGHPMISDRVRELTFEGRYAIQPPVIQLPTVQLNTRYIEPIGQEWSKFGGHDLFSRRNEVITRWNHRDFFGIPSLKNLTPELFIRGHNSEEFGNAFLRLEWRPVKAIGGVTQAFGRPAIAFRDRQFMAWGIGPVAVSDKLKVTKTGAPPYYDQYIWLNGVREGYDESIAEGDGIAPPRNQVSNPSLKTNVIYPSGFNASVIPQPIAKNMGIVIESGIGIDGIGTHSISMSIRQVLVNGIDNTVVVSRPVISPQTIWAVMEAPNQAISNHPDIERHYVNSDRGRRAPGVVFGRPTVTLQKRYINNVGNIWGSWIPDTNRIYNKIQRVGVSGINSLRFGWLEIPGDRILEQFYSSDSMIFGTTRLSRPPYVGPLFITGRGFIATTFGNNRIELFNRTVSAHSFNSMLMGSSRGGTLYKPQSLHVGPSLPTIPNGFDPSRYGTPVITFRVREIKTPSITHFAMEYDYTKFDLRMRVIRYNKPIPAIRVAPLGFDALQINASNVRNSVYYIRPDGDSDQYRKGAF